MDNKEKNWYYKIRRGLNFLLQRKEQRVSYKTIFWGIVWIVGGFLLWYHVVGDPFDEIALIQGAQIASGILSDQYEDEQEDDRGHVYFSDIGIYTFQTPDGREYKTHTQVPSGQLEENWKSNTSR